MTTTREIRIEPSTVCNYACVMCARDSLSRRRETMSDELFERIVDAALADLPQLELCTVSGFGELAADPRWPQKLEVARERFPRVHVVTNLSLVRDDQLELLSRLATEVRVSLYSVDEESFRRIHRPPAGVSHALVEGRIRRLSALRRPGFRLQLSCCAIDEAHAGVTERWIETWRDLVDDLEVWQPHNWVAGKRYRRVEGRIPSCGRPASGPLQVQVDGTMNVCCFDYDGVMLIGDLRRQPLREILEGPELRRVRELHAAGRADELPLCAVCDQREPAERRAARLLYTSRASRERRVLQTSSGRERLPAAERAESDPR